MTQNDELADAWDAGWDAGNFYAIDDFNRDYKTSNPYRKKWPSPIVKHASATFAPLLCRFGFHAWRFHSYSEGDVCARCDRKKAA